jgi:signal transduction histidine kinase
VAADSVRRIAQEVGAMSRTVLTDMRSMIHQLRPTALIQLGLEEAIRALIDSTTNRTGIRFSLTAATGLGGLAPEMTEDVYYIVAEAIHNVVKHADASWITLRMGVRDDVLKLTVIDNGSGIRAVANEGEREPGAGYGLTTMRDRAERWGGAFEIQPRRGRTGTAVTVTVPLAVVQVPAATQDQEGSSK